MTELPDAVRAVHGPYRAVFELMFNGLGVELVDLPVHEGDTPSSLRDADAWIVTGSPASVFDDLGWIRTAEELVREAVRIEAPLVGICFGHQLVAQALGGCVERSAGGWALGAKVYDTVEPLPWFPEGNSRSTILAAHQDQVVRAPTDAAVWSTSSYCPIAGMTIGDRMWTLQGHPDFTPAMVAALGESERDHYGGGVVDQAIASLDQPLSNADVARAIIRFIGTP